MWHSWSHEVDKRKKNNSPALSANLRASLLRRLFSLVLLSCASKPDCLLKTKKPNMSKMPACIQHAHDYLYCILCLYHVNRKQLIGPKPVAFKMTKKFRVQSSCSFTVSWYPSVITHFSTAPVCVWQMHIHQSDFKTLCMKGFCATVVL